MSPPRPGLEAAELQALRYSREGGLFSLLQGPFVAFNTDRIRVQWLHAQKRQGFQAMPRR